MEGSASRYPLPSHFLPDRKRKRFLAFARNDDAGKPAFPLLPLEGGAPKGAEVGFRSGMKKREEAFPPFRHPERSRGIFFVSRFRFPS